MFEVKGRRVRISRGDTGQVVIAARGVEFGAADRAVVTVKPAEGVRGALIERTLSVSADGTCVWVLTNEDTQDLEPDSYSWDVRFVLGAELDEDGRVIDGAAVLTPFAPQPFEVLEVVGDV